MKRIKVKPRAGVVVMDEYGRPFPEGTTEINATVYNRRRIKDGDLLVVTEEDKPAPTKRAKRGEDE